jgi:hypothetical protein
LELGVHKDCMRWLIAWTAILSSTVFFGGNLFAQQSLTVKGVTYADAELIKEYPQSVYISHTTGLVFIKRADLSAEDLRALGISNPSTDPFQATLDKDFQEFQSGNTHLPSALSPVERPAPTPSPSPPVTVARPPPHPSSIAAIQKQWRDYHDGRTDHPLSVGAGSAPARGETQQEAQQEGSPLLIDLSERSGGRSTGSSRNAQRRQSQIRENHLSDQIQDSSSRNVSGFDYSGNFYQGSVAPSGAFSGIRQGPSGAAIINDNFDQNGGFVRPH